MPLVIGILLALAVGVMGTIVQLDRDRAFYPTIMIVIALLYSLFAVIGGSTQELMLEALVGSVFLAMALWGFKSSLWIVVMALAGHGVMDIFHGRVIDNPGVPTFWPAFCSSYDLVAAVYLAWLIRSGRVPATD